MTATDTAAALSYVVTRTVTLTVDVTTDDARLAHRAGETCAEYAAQVADGLPLSAWTVTDETVDQA
jgi:hypothetical protein